MREAGGFEARPYKNLVTQSRPAKLVRSTSEAESNGVALPSLKTSYSYVSMSLAAGSVAVAVMAISPPQAPAPRPRVVTFPRRVTALPETVLYALSRDEDFTAGFLERHAVQARTARSMA